MTTAGIRELKARLSEYIGKVRNGETVRVTDRGKTVAMLTPPAEPAPFPEWMRKAAAEGKITLPTRQGPIGLAKPIKTRGKPLSQMIIEDRG
jgi:prevent-host-death family protein